MYGLVGSFLSQSQISTFHFALYASISIDFWNGLVIRASGIALRSLPLTVPQARATVLHYPWANLRLTAEGELLVAQCTGP